MPKALEHPRGQRPHFGLRALEEGHWWYRSHNEMKYFLDIPIDVDSLAWDYPQVYQRCMDYHLIFLFEEPLPCNLSLVCEFYANMETVVRFQVVTI